MCVPEVGKMCCWLGEKEVVMWAICVRRVGLVSNDSGQQVSQLWGFRVAFAGNPRLNCGLCPKCGRLLLKSAALTLLR